MEYKLRKTPDEVVELAVAAVKRAASYTPNVEFSAEDASRTDRDFLVRIVTAAIDAGATTINIPDTVGFAQPDEFGALIRYVIDNVPNSDKAIFSVHCHDDLGLAVANSLAAVKNGARQAELCLSGIGERAGNASLEEFVMALKLRPEYYGVECSIVTEQLYPSCHLLSLIIGRPIPANKAIIGSNAFAHESGIHQDGMLKNRNTYEIMTPQAVGRKSTDIVIGKHSGRNAVRTRLEELGYTLDNDQVQRRVRRHEGTRRQEGPHSRRRPRSPRLFRSVPHAHSGSLPPEQHLRADHHGFHHAHHRGRGHAGSRQRSASGGLRASAPSTRPST